MPVQHISDHLLKAMNRNITKQQTVDLIKKIRNKIPNASLRTTFIVGMPGETQEDFLELGEFVKEARFEKVGVFVYSREEGTLAHDMPGQVSEQVKKERMDALMMVQQDISRGLQEKLIGQTLKVIVDGLQKGEDHVYLGRSEYDAPEVDGIVYVHSKEELAPGDFVTVKITDAYEYDLVGEVI